LPRLHICLEKKTCLLETVSKTNLQKVDLAYIKSHLFAIAIDQHKQTKWQRG